MVKKLELQPKRKRLREKRIEEIKNIKKANFTNAEIKEYLDLTNERLEEQWDLLKSKLGSL
jgi:DNA-binding transcriptional MerR regulator